MSKFRIYTEQSDYGRHMRLAILVEELDGISYIVEPLAFKKVEPHELAGPYTMEQGIRTERIMPNGDRHFSVLDGRALLQAMLDHAWESGLRPTGLSDADTTKQIAAMNDHLADMRRLVFEGPMRVAIADRATQ